MVIPFLEMSASLLQRVCQRAAMGENRPPRTSSRAKNTVIASGGGGVWRSGIIACGVAATMVAISDGGGCVLGQVQPAVTATPDPPSVAATMRVYREIEGRVRAWSMPEAKDGGETFSGVAITLRLDGAVVGRGVVIDGREGGVERATALAMREADQRLPLPWDATREARRGELAKEVEISVELAGPLVPFRADTWGDVDMGLSPGLWGVAARFGERVAGVFPGVMLLSGQSPSDGLRAAISEASGDPLLATMGVNGQPGKIARDRGAIYYRFRVAHLAQPEAGAAPVFLHRGGQIVPKSAITTASLRDFAAKVAAHLQGRCRFQGDGAVITAIEWPGAKSSAGDPATTLDTALAAYALARYSAVEGVEEQAAREARATARALLAGVRVHAGDASGEAMVEAAMLVVAWHALGGLEGEGGDWLTVARGQLSRALGASGEWHADVPEGARGLMLLALVREARSRGEEASVYAAAARAIYREATGAKLLAQMPWLLLAERDIAGARGEIKAASALRDALDQMWTMQVTEEEAGLDDVDMAGGFVFSGTGAPLPTWHSLRGLAYGGVALQDARLVGVGDRLPLVAKLVSGARFARQLALDPPAAHLAARRSTVAWGVRAAVWDFKQPVSASAMGLVAISEMLDGLGAMGRAEASPER